MDINTTDKEIEEYISEQCGEDSAIGYFTNPNYATAILGISIDNCLVYSYDKMVEYLLETNKDWEMMDAIEWIDYNVIPTISYMPYPPIIVYDIME